MNRLVAAVVLLFSMIGVGHAGEVSVALRIRPELAFDGTERIFLGPILAESSDDPTLRRVDRAAVEEFDRYVRRLIRRKTNLVLVEKRNDLRPPSRSLLELQEDGGFWRELGDETQAEFIVAASIDVRVLDRAGYQTEEFVSPEDGKTYFRQVLVEETGFAFDILLEVFDGATGKLLHEEQITDFRERSIRQLDEYKDMYKDLFHVENRLLGIFVPRVIHAKRFLYN